MGVVTGSGKTCVLVPIETHACNSGGVARGRSVDGQVQRQGAVATVGVAALKHMGVVTGSGKTCVLVPIKTHACNSGGVARGRFIHYQCSRCGNAATGSRFGHLQCVGASVAGLEITDGGIFIRRSESGRTGPSVGHIARGICERALEFGRATSAHFVHRHLNLQRAALCRNAGTILVRTARVHIFHGHCIATGIKVFKSC